MVFNSFEFILFFLVFYPIFLVFPASFRWFWLLISSWFLYAAFNPEYIILLLLLTLVDYYCGKEIHRRNQTAKKIFLVISLLCNIGILVFFKYLGFFSGIIGSIFNISIQSGLLLALPIGISFHTFQGMAYVIDIYRGTAKPEPRFGIFALYISIFPQLVAGPIERAQHLIPQLKEKFYLTLACFKEAIALILVGCVKKLAIADNLGIVVNVFYDVDKPYDFNGSTLVIATIFYGFQLYCDFSGYVDIARGLAKLLGVDFVINFNKPYFSTTVTDFWRKWHISLSTWVRDYLYIPLGGNRKGLSRQIINLLVTMTAMGLWHGANLTFVVWGAYHGLLLAAHKLISVVRVKFFLPLALPAVISGILTFVFVNLGWIFFRSRDIGESLKIMEKIFSPSLFQLPQYSDGMLLGFWLTAGLLFAEILDIKFKLKKILVEVNPFFFSLVCALLLYFVIFLSAKNTVNFIYSQF